MTRTFSIGEAKTNLSKLVALAESGERVELRRGKQPVARLVALPKPGAVRRKPGALARGRRTRARDRRLKLLVDTHAALWWLADDPRLSAPAREAISGAEEPLLGAGTLFEVAIKASLGKLEAPADWAEELLAEGFSLLAISLAHARAYRELPYVELGGKPHRDTFDRLLVAQSMVEAVPLVTCDPGIAAHGVPTLW